MNDYRNPNKGFIKFKRKNKNTKITSAILLVSIALIMFGVVLYIYKSYTSGVQERIDSAFKPNINTKNSEDSIPDKRQETQFEYDTQNVNNSQTEIEVRVDDM